MNPFAKQAPLPHIKNILVVGSGKGGVGKSTVAVNLASSLKHLEQKVALLDADIYGPSIPRMLGASFEKPALTEEGKIKPLRRFGLSLMSMGFLVDEGAAIIWRGPMLFKAMEQLLRDVEWGELDFLIIDLPPGTGDVALTIAQKVPVQGAIAVCTPQNIALADAKRALDMFERINVPVLGVVENMAGLQVPGLPEKVNLFPTGELDAFLSARHIEKLASLDFFPDIGIAGEAGVPILESDAVGSAAQQFMALGRKVLEQVRKNYPPNGHPPSA